MADAQQQDSHADEDGVIDVAPDPQGPTDVGVRTNPRRNGNGRPRAEKPKERSRIHPEGEPGEHATNDDDAGDDESPTAEKADEKKPQKKAESKSQKDGDGKDDGKQDRPVYKKPIFWIALVVLLVGVVIGLLYYLHARDYQSTDDAFIEGHAIQISPQVAAKVIKVYIDDNARVRAGDPLVELDPTDYDVALNQAKGNENAAMGRLEQSKATVENSRSSRDEAKAALDASMTQFENADRDLKRYEALDERARSKQQYDNAVTAQKNAAAQVNQAKARVANAESQINVSVANVSAAQGEYETAVADRRRAEVNLGYCHITAPGTLNGFARVTTKNVEEGSYAAAGTPLFALVEERVWVVANYKETQLTDVRLNQPVTIQIDAYPDQEFRGHVDSVQAGSGSRFSVLPAENATGNYVKVVQRIPVKIVFEDGQSKDPNRVLVPGMSVTPYVKIR